MKSTSVIDIPQEYFFDEVRDGFYIPGMMKKCWAVSYKSYKDLEKICENNGLGIFVAFGTLIGVIRDGGYIPWDDDFDLLCLRNDYNELKRISDEGCLPGQYWLCDYEYNKDENMTRMWIDSSSMVRKMEDLEDNYGYPIYDPIDIFILDHIPSGEEDRKNLLILIEMYARLTYSAMAYAGFSRRGASEVDEVDVEDFMLTLKKLEKLTGKPFPINGEVPLFVRILRQLEENVANIRHEKDESYSILTHFLSNNSWLLKKKWFSGFIEMPFEYGAVRVPIGYDGALRFIYGSHYMMPYLEGGIHGYPFYKGIEEDLMRIAGCEFPSYHINIDEYKEAVVSRESMREKKRTLKMLLKDVLETFMDAHEYLLMRLCCDDTDKNDLEELLIQCQELAISTGNTVEKKAINGKNLVKRFENYCELIYGIYQNIDIDSENTTLLFSEFERFLADLSVNVEEKTELVFLCYRAEHFKFIKSIYEEAYKDEKVHPVLIMVPYYVKNYDGSIDKENMRIESIDEESGIYEIVDYDKYDFLGEHPDAIIHQCPYDEYNDAYSMHPFFYAANLYKFTDKMILIPPFVTRELVSSSRLVKTMEDYLCQPGGIYVDLIIAQSESTATEYTKILNGFTEKESGGNDIDNERKVLGVGSAIWDFEDEIVEDNKEKKVIAFYISGSMLLDYGLKGVEKAKKALEIIEKRIDSLNVYWYADEFACEILRNRDRDTWKALMELQEEFKNGEYGILDDDFPSVGDENYNYAAELEKYGKLSREDRVVSFADAAYGDGGTLLTKMRLAGKPVMVEIPYMEARSYEKTPDDYQIKKWTESTGIVFDDEWTLSNFLDEVLNYKKCRKNGNYGEKILHAILN